MTSNSEDSANVGSIEQPKWWQRHRWAPLVLPLAVYMLAGQLESKFVGLQQPRETESAADLAADVSDKSDTSATVPVRAALAGRRYAIAYSVRIGLTLVAVALVFPYYRTVPFRLHALSLLFGVVGGAIWILVCRLRWEQQFSSAVGLASWMASGQRAAFDPLTTFEAAPALMVAFLAVRFLGLVVLVPLIEEFFLRGFLMRFFRQADWWTIPWGDVTASSALVATAYGVLSHPAEAIAAAIWFSLITLLYVRTRSIWDCVVAHAVTNLVLGVYVLVWRDWSLW